MMNNFKSQHTKHYSIFKQNNKKSTRLTQNQVRLLEASFNASNRLDPNRKLQLAQELHIPPRQVATWYQNRRARWKNQSLEVDYSALHVRLETVLAQKGQLEEEVQRLRVELQKSQAEIAYLQKRQIQPTVSFPSSLINDDQMNCLFMNDHDQGLGVEEVYDYLIVTNGSNFN